MIEVRYGYRDKEGTLVYPGGVTAALGKVTQTNAESCLVALPVEGSGMVEIPVPKGMASVVVWFSARDVAE
jgi:hypothetical protein